MNKQNGKEQLSAPKRETSRLITFHRIIGPSDLVRLTNPLKTYKDNTHSLVRENNSASRNFVINPLLSLPLFISRERTKFTFNVNWVTFSLVSKKTL